MRRRQVFLPMFAIEIRGRSKEDRVTNALQYRYEHGVIFHVNGALMGGEVPATNSDYETQAQLFPRVQHDDMIDAHAYAADIVRYDGVETEDEKQVKDSPYNFERKMKDMERKAKDAESLREYQYQEAIFKANNPTYQSDDEYYSEIE